MAQSSSELTTIHLRRLATPGKKYYGDNEKVYIGTSDRRLRLLDDASNLLNINSIAQNAVGSILTDTATIDFTYDSATPSITADVINSSITYSKIQDVSASRLLGRATASIGVVEEITLGTGLSFAATTLNVSGVPSISITDDNITNAVMYPLWSSVSSGVATLSASSTKLNFNPSTGSLFSSGNVETPQIYGSSLANGDLLIDGTSNATKTSSYVNIQPSGGNVIVGSTASATTPTVTSFSVSKNITGGASANSIRGEGTVQSDVTSTSRMFVSYPSTDASIFVLTNLNHYEAIQNTIGAGSSVTNQVGFRVDSSLSGATNNYGFLGNITAASNNYNLYMSSTAKNYLAGNLGIANLSPTSTLDVTGTAAISTSVTTPQIYGSAAANGDITIEGTSSATKTSSYIILQPTGGNVGVGTNAPAFRFVSTTSTANDVAIRGTISATTGVNYGSTFLATGAGATTNIGGYFNASGGTNNRGIQIQSIAAGATNYSIYSDAVAQSYFAGNLGIGQTTTTAYLHIKAGTATASTAPIKLTAGTVLTTPEAGVLETNSGNQLYYSTSTSTESRGFVNVTRYIAKTANYTLTANDWTVDCTSGTFAITLPTAVGISGRTYNIKNSGTGVITINTTSSQTIDTQVSGYWTLAASSFANMYVQSNGANWIIL